MSIEQQNRITALEKLIAELLERVRKLEEKRGPGRPPKEAANG